MENIYEQYLAVSEQKKAITSKLEELQVAIYNQNLERYNEKEVGTINVNDNGYAIKVVKKMNTKVDQALASVVDIGFTKKYSFDKNFYKTLSASDQKRVDECLTTAPAKPTFSVERIVQ